MLTNHIYISQDSWVYTHLARVVTLHTSFGLVVTPSIPIIVGKDSYLYYKDVNTSK